MRDLGDIVTLTFNTVDAAGTAVAVTSAAVAVTLPDGTAAATTAVANPSLGTYTSTFIATQAGRHLVRWTSTGANQQAYADVVDISPAAPNLAISVADARAQLRNQPAQGSPLTDDRIRDYCAAVTHLIEAEVGPVISGSRTLVVNGGTAAVLLPAKVVAVTAVSETGVALTSSDYTTDLAAGILYRGTPQNPFPFRPGAGNITITYTVGTTNSSGGTYIPANVRLAAGIVLRQLWQVDQQGYRPAFGQPDQSMASGPVGFAMPKAALELLLATPGMPGFA